MKNVVLVTLALASILLTGCRSAKRTTSNTEANSANAPLAKTVNTEQPAREPQWAQVAPNISLMGIARKGLDESNSTAEKPEYIYQIEVHLKNTGAATINFDTVLIAFEPGKGEPLRQQVTSRALNELGAVDERKVLTINLKNGEEKDWDAELLGATTAELLKSAGGEPVVFSLGLQAKGKTIAGPFRASLPELSSLPVPTSGQRLHENRRQAPGANLKFQ
jgi:hypothetical protein